MSDFVQCPQGEYSQREKDGLKEFLAQSEALRKRGPIDVKAMLDGTLPKDTPGYPTIWRVDEAMMDYQSGKYDPDNPLYTDNEYSKRLGYKAKLAYPTFAACDDLILTAFPMWARDIMCVSSLDNCVEQVLPIYAGDTLYTVKDAINIRDISTPEGCDYRSFAIMCYGTVYNQNGDVVSRLRFGATENLKTWAASEHPQLPPWESPPWWQRNEHYYTDGDYDAMIAMWNSEHRQGDEPLYWQDVTVGQRPKLTLEGPIEASASPTAPFGMGIGGSRTLRHQLCDPETRAKMRRSDETGIYYPQNTDDLIPQPPEFQRLGGPMDASAMKKEEPRDLLKKAPNRGIFINFIGRDYAIRHINNWMGSHGWLKQIRWGIMTELKDYGYTIPMNGEITNYIKQIPAAANKHWNAHGLQYDCMVVRSQVLSKYMENGEYLAKLGFWIETIEGDVIEHGDAIVRLPSKP